MWHRINKWNCTYCSRVHLSCKRRCTSACKLRCRWKALIQSSIRCHFQRCTIQCPPMCAASLAIIALAKVRNESIWHALQTPHFRWNPKNHFHIRTNCFPFAIAPACCASAIPVEFYKSFICRICCHPRPALPTVNEPIHGECCFHCSTLLSKAVPTQVAIPSAVALSRSTLFS